MPEKKKNLTILVGYMREDVGREYSKILTWADRNAKQSSGIDEMDCSALFILPDYSIDPLLPLRLKDIKSLHPQRDANFYERMYSVDMADEEFYQPLPKDKSHFQFFKSQLTSSVKAQSKYDIITIIGHSVLDTHTQAATFSGVCACDDMVALSTSLKKIIAQHLEPTKGHLRLQICNADGYYAFSGAKGTLLDELSPKGSELRIRTSAPEGFSIVCPNGTSIDLSSRVNVDVFKLLCSLIYSSGHHVYGVAVCDNDKVNPNMLRRKMKAGENFAPELVDILRYSSIFREIAIEDVKIVIPGKRPKLLSEMLNEPLAAEETVSTEVLFNSVPEGSAACSSN